MVMTDTDTNEINPMNNLDEIQLAAVTLCTDSPHRVVGVSGPAGSGKTTIIRKVYEYWTNLGYNVALAAPTGKAARRIKEATGIEAQTIHKLLEYGRPGEIDEKTGKPVDPTFPRRIRSNPLDQSIVIVDEYMMVTYELHDNLIAALPSGGRLFAFGDVNQLPPVETNQILRSKEPPFKKILSKKDASIALEKVYRQGEGSTILSNANKIRKGHTVSISKTDPEFQVHISDYPQRVLKEHILNSDADYRALTNQIITPQKKGALGTRGLNEYLRALLNPSPEQELQLPRMKHEEEFPVTIGIGDKVVCTSNSYDLRDYFDRFTEFTEDSKPVYASFIPTPATKMMLNGETGIVTAIYPDGTFELDMGDRLVEVPARYSEYWAEKERLFDVQPGVNIDLAYALTTHKCQGSEYKNVVYIINRAHYYMLGRQNFYTAVTRARNYAMIIADQAGLRAAITKVNF
jgi:exodeoxyribonuclease V alpha subunit